MAIAACSSTATACALPGRAERAAILQGRVDVLRVGAKPLTRGIEIAPGIGGDLSGGIAQRSRDVGQIKPLATAQAERDQRERDQEHHAPRQAGWFERTQKHCRESW